MEKGRGRPKTNRGERLHTLLRKGYVKKLRRIRDQKGWGGVNYVIEFLIDEYLSKES